MMSMNIYYKLKGGHYHMRVFIDGGKMGDLVCREYEFEFVKQSINANWIPEAVVD